MEQTTDMLTPEQKKQQASAYMEMAKRLNEEALQMEIGEQPAHADKKSVSVSKWIINISYIIFGICGIIGSFWGAFDMMKFTEFLKVFAWIWAPLVVAVGGGRAFKNYVTKKYDGQKTNGA